MVKFKITNEHGTYDYTEEATNFLAELIEEYLIWHEKNKFVMPPTLKSFASWLKQRGR